MSTNDQSIDNATAEQPMIDRRLLIPLSLLPETYNFNIALRNHFKGSTDLLGDLLTSETGALETLWTIKGVGVGAISDFRRMLGNIGLEASPPMTLEQWREIDLSDHAPVSLEELQGMPEIEEKRQESERLAQEKAQLEKIQSQFTDAQRALLQPQTVEIDDPDVTDFQAKIPSGVIPEDDIRDGRSSNSSKLTKLAIALTTLEGEQPKFLFVTSQDNYGVIKVKGVIGRLTDENRALLGLKKVEGFASATASKNYERFGPAFPSYGDKEKYFLVKEPGCLARIGIIPQTPVIKIKGQKPAADPA